jgi:hypothetical protein
MATEINQLAEVVEHDFATGSITTRLMTEQEYADWLATVEFIKNNPTT